jgi:hypothetical protein
MKKQKEKLVELLFDQMEKLDKHEISKDQANSQALLAKQINTVMRIDIDRAQTEIKIREFNAKNNESIKLKDSVG